MSVIILLLIASITVASLFLGFYIWSVKSGQYDDEQSPPFRILFDDSPPVKANQTSAAINKKIKASSSNPNLCK